jgi:hypothetical protein
VGRKAKERERVRGFSPGLTPRSRLAGFRPSGPGTLRHPRNVVILSEAKNPRICEKNAETLRCTQGDSMGAFADIKSDVCARGQSKPSPRVCGFGSRGFTSGI